MLRALVANALVLGGMAWMLVSGTEQRAAPVLGPEPRAMADDIARLEASASAPPTSASVVALAGAYLDREQPGLAAAVIERAPRELRDRPEVALLRARTLFHRGHSREALAVARDAYAACAAHEAEVDPGPSACPAWLEARTARQLAFLTEVVAAGVDDPVADPLATLAAYERSTREVRLVAMR
jgi:hypothetical protein